MKSSKFQIVSFILITYASIAVTQIEPKKPRDVIGIRGSEASSYDWHPEINKMQSLDNYLVRDAFSNLAYNLNATVADNVKNCDNMVKSIPVGGTPYKEVMAWGHDVGGLVARGLRNKNSNVNTLLLTGTPNRGSNLLRDIISSQPSNIPIPLETWFESFQKWKGDSNCPECDKPKLMLDFIKRLKQGANYLKGGQNDPQGYYASLPNPDPATTIILWGSASKQPLGEFLGSMGGISEDSFVDIEGCSKRLRIIREQNLKNEILIRQINDVSNFFTLIKNFLNFTLLKPVKDKDGIVIKPNLINVFSTLIDFIKSESDKLILQIKKDEEIRKETKDLLLCELANQRMEAEWLHRIMSGTGRLTTILVPNPTNDPSQCAYYQYQCNFNHQHPNHASFCYYADLYCPDAVYGLEMEENDLLFTRIEQTLPIVVKYTGKMDNTNHFQEQQWSRIKPHVDSYFLNKLDPFHIPKN